MPIKMIVLVLSTAILLSGCGSDKKEKNETSAQKTEHIKEVEEPNILVEDTKQLGNDSEGKTKDHKIYDIAQALPVMNGLKTKKLGEMSLIKTDSSLVDLEVLNDRYYNYVKKTDYMYYIIVYVDKDEQVGVFTNSTGIIEDGVSIAKNEGEYEVIDNSNAIMYVSRDDGTLKLLDEIIDTQEE